MSCKIEGCGRPGTRARGMCTTHYMRVLRHGDPHYVTPRVKVDPVVRFWSKVDRRSDAECWPWLGTVVDDYGTFTTGRGQAHLAHRYVYELTVGPIPDGLTIDHVKARGCERKDCVNPAHLEAVTVQENLRRSNAWSAVNSRKERCPEGHEYDRLRNRGDGRVYRQCSTCYNEAQRARRAAKREGRAA